MSMTATTATANVPLSFTMRTINGRHYAEVTTCVPEQNRAEHRRMTLAAGGSVVRSAPALGGYYVTTRTLEESYV